MNMSSATGFEPKISIVIPVYNGADYVAQAIDSALAQTYPHIEIIVVNDGSTDNGASEAAILKYGDKVTYLKKQNGGCGSALNAGITAATGEYISWLSHDDLYYPEKIRKQVDMLATLQNRETILYGGYDLINKASRLTGSVRPNDTYSLELLNKPLHPVMRGLLNGCTLLIPKQLFQRVGLFREDLPTTQDYDLWAKLFRHAEVRFMPENLVKTRVHAAQGSQQISGHTQECNDLWIRLISDVTPEEAVALDGSYTAFLLRSVEFLRHTPYTQALEMCETRAAAVIDPIKVSVVMPFFNRIPDVVQAVQSVQNQTHRNWELLLIDDGSSDDLLPLRTIIEQDPRIIYVATENKGPSTARNLGMQKATGTYIAFLDSDDVFIPTKIAQQLRFMEREQALFSHTDYIARNLDKGTETQVRSSALRGNIYPAIIKECLIATPTVMVQRAFVSNFRFPEQFALGEDFCLWADLAQKTPLAALDQPLTVVNVSTSSASQDETKLMLGIVNTCSYLLRSDIHRQHKNEIKELLKSIAVEQKPHYVYTALHLHFVVAIWRSLQDEGVLRTGKKMIRYVWIRLMRRITHEAK